MNVAVILSKPTADEGKWMCTRRARPEQTCDGGGTAQDMALFTARERPIMKETIP